MTRFVLSSGPVTVVALHVDISSLTGSADVRMALYTDNAGTPNTLKTQSNALPVTVGWNTFPVPGVALSAPATYWIGVVHNDGADLGISDYTAGAASDGYENYGSISSWPSTFPSGGSSWNNTLSVYADVCP